MLPSRCFRCGAVSREALCAPCVDYLVAYRPLWLDPSLLPGPSLLDLLGPREAALLSVEGTELEWRSSPRTRTAEDAMRLIDLLGLESESHPIVSVGDAEVLHGFLGEGRRSTPRDAGAREALAALYRFLASREWMPSHLAEEYRLRARALARVPEEEAVRVAVARIEEFAEEPAKPKAEILPRPEEEEMPPVIPAAPEELEAPFPPPESIPPEPSPPEPTPEREPGKPVEGGPVAPPAPALDLARVKEEIKRERKSVEAWVHERTEAIATKEEALLEREQALETKAQEMEEQVKALEARLLAVEKDEARREVLRFLASVPGMTEDGANMIATAFPDMASLLSADERALTQCRGVTATLARAIRYVLVPGEVDEEQRAIGLREEAHAFLEEGDYRAALACYDRLLSERPEDVGVWFEKAQVLVLLSHPEDALQCYQRVIDLDRRNRQAWFERANLLFGMGRLADAVDALRETLRIDPSKSGDIALKAEQLRRDRHGNEAAILFQAILDVEPESPRAILGLADTLLDLGDTEAAEGLLTRALGKGAHNPPILFRKGELLRQKGRWGAAVQFYNRTIALQWDHADAWMAKGEILLEHGRAQEALECFDHVLQVDPKRGEAWARKALAHRAIHQGKEATEALRRAIDIAPDNPAVLAARSVIEAREPAVREPEEELEELLEAMEPFEEEGEEGKPSEPEVPPEGTTESFAETWKAAVEEPEEAKPAAIPADFKSFVDSIEPEKEDTHVLVQLAELALESGDAEMALLRYRQAVDRDPRSADGWTGIGTALQQLERYEEALKAYDRALELNPEHEMAKRWRETCLRHLGKGATS